ncbi:MAG: putative membrane protein [Gammaproteobacteria bacterium]|jgi:uncharacterized membrane protein
MPTPDETMTVIGLMVLIVYSTRLGGYLIGLQLRHIQGIKPVLEALPGCAFMAILVPAVRQGSLIEVISLVVVVILMWKTDNVVIATFSGMLILLFGDSMIPVGLAG